ncbi:hypothetical protein AC579_6220 [Pseudocercospora musae]|uniref:Uncharacterized protein n=1 Tax=Pseudocercospora musae TaxID=113226 RepID=A0A139HTC0_9PEZI|nr:hypothetical protein AC579_6220 [Pseudocercospora musae]
MVLRFVSLAAAAVAQTGTPGQTNGWESTPAQRLYISTSQAQDVVKAAIDKSNAKQASSQPVLQANLSSVPNNIAVVDSSAQLVAFLGMDHAYLGSVNISIQKAKTVALFKALFPSYGLYNRSQPGPMNDLYTIQETYGGLVVFESSVVRELRRARPNRTYGKPRLKSP